MVVKDKENYRDDRESGIHWIKTLCEPCHEKRIKSYEEARRLKG